MSSIPELAVKATKFDQELKNLKDGVYHTTMMLGNSIRKFLNQFHMIPNLPPNVSAKVSSFIAKFEESFQLLDNKTLFEEVKSELGLQRKKSGSFYGKKMNRQGSTGHVDYNRPMNDEEKKELSRSIRTLTAKQLKGIINIVRDMFPEKNGMLEFDIDKLPTQKCWQLREYVQRAINDDKKPPRSIVPPKIGSLGRQMSGGFPTMKRSTMSNGGTGTKLDDLGGGGLDSSLQKGANPIFEESSESGSESSDSSYGSANDLASKSFK